MLERIIKLTAVLLIGSVVLPGCSQFTHSGRQQAAYRRYVKKCSKNRVKWRNKLAKKKARIPNHQLSEYRVDAAAVDGPQSVSSVDQ